MVCTERSHELVATFKQCLWGEEGDYRLTIGQSGRKISHAKAQRRKKNQRLTLRLCAFAGDNFCPFWILRNKLIVKSRVRANVMGQKTPYNLEIKFICMAVIKVRIRRRFPILCTAGIVQPNGDDLLKQLIVRHPRVLRRISKVFVMRDLRIRIRLQ